MTPDLPSTAVWHERCDLRHMTTTFAVSRKTARSRPSLADKGLAPILDILGRFGVDHMTV